MAKFGEGDARWIVENRADGTNVHNWHWTEKDCMEWAKQKLGELLENVKVLEGQGSCWLSTSKLESVEGEAYVNIRKGKIIPGYELNVKLNWQGEVRDSTGAVTAKVDGKIEFPYIADENSDEAPEITVSLREAGPVGKTLREAMLSQGKPLLLNKIKLFVKEISQGGPAKEELESKLSKKTSQARDASIPSTVTAQMKTSTPATKAEPKKDSKGSRTITMVQKFHCRQKDLYETLTDEKRWMAFTQSKARISNEVGGTFSVFDGAVTGINQQLKPNSLIIQKWRFSSWADGHYSKVCITIEEPETGVTVLKLTHTDVPEEDRFGNATVYETTERGWRDLIFHKIRAVFGYGL